MTPRQRRLNSDYENLVNEFSNHPYISIEFEKKENSIPERYIVNYKDIRGIKLSRFSTSENKIIDFIYNHKIEIYLHLDYPRLKPQCYILTEIFHPNFRMAHPHDICIGDFWASGETLVDIIYQAGEMIQYKNYGIQNPLNGIAAKWARENISLLPIDNTNLRIGDIEISLKNNGNVKIDLK
jgi:ubiquitin-protein ligase